MWRNWQTHLTQNQAEIIRAGSSPAIGIRKALPEKLEELFSYLLICMLYQIRCKDNNILSTEHRTITGI